MSSASSVRPPKRHRDEIDDKIEALSKVVDQMTGPKKAYLLAKLCNIKLKKQKLMALSRSCSHSETNQQSLVTEFDMMIAENDIEIEIQSIRSSKKFRRTENRYLERLFRDPHNREKAYNSIPNRASTSWNTSAETSAPVCTAHDCRQNVPQKTLSRVPVCDKSTNTASVYILNLQNFNETKLPANGDISSSPIKSLVILEENASPVEALMSPSQENASPIMEIKLPIKENESPNKENLLQTGEHIQSKWFENSFDIEHIIVEKPGVSLQQAGNESWNRSASKSTEKKYKHKTYQRQNKKDCEAKESSISEPFKNIVTEQTSTADPIPVSKINKPSKVSTKNDALPSGNTVQLPEATMIFPYKNIYSSDKVTRNSVKSLFATQNDINNASFDKKSLPITNDLNTPDKCNKKFTKKTDYNENNQTSKKILQQTFKSPKKIAKNTRSSEDIQTNISQRKSTTSKDLPKQSQDISAKSKYLSAKSEYLSTKSLDLSAKYKTFSAKTQDLSAKSQDLAAKSKYLSAKSEYLSTKSQDLSAESQDLAVKSKYLSAESKDLSTESLELSTKYKDPSTESLELSAKPKVPSTESLEVSAKSKDFSTKSQDLSAKSQDLSAKSQDLSAKSQDLATKSLFARCKDLFTESLELSTKSQDLSAKSNGSSLITKCQEHSAKCMASARTQDLIAKCMEFSVKCKSSTKKGHKSSLKKDRPKEKICGQNSSSSSVLNDRKAVLYIKELVKKELEKICDILHNDV